MFNYLAEMDGFYFEDEPYTLEDMVTTETSYLFTLKNGSAFLRLVKVKDADGLNVGVKGHIVDVNGTALYNQGVVVTTLEVSKDTKLPLTVNYTTCHLVGGLPELTKNALTMLGERYLLPYYYSSRLGLINRISPTKEGDYKTIVDKLITLVQADDPNIEFDDIKDKLLKPLLDVYADDTGLVDEVNNLAKHVDGLFETTTKNITNINLVKTDVVDLTVGSEGGTFAIASVPTTVTINDTPTSDTKKELILDKGEMFFQPVVFPTNSGKGITLSTTFTPTENIDGLETFLIDKCFNTVSHLLESELTGMTVEECLINLTLLSKTTYGSFRGSLDRSRSGKEGWLIEPLLTGYKEDISFKDSYSDESFVYDFKHKQSRLEETITEADVITKTALLKADIPERYPTVSGDFETIVTRLSNNVNLKGFIDVDTVIPTDTSGVWVITVNDVTISFGSSTFLLQKNDCFVSLLNKTTLMFEGRVIGWGSDIKSYNQKLNELEANIDLLLDNDSTLLDKIKFIEKETIAGEMVFKDTTLDSRYKNLFTKVGGEDLLLSLNTHIKNDLHNVSHKGKYQSIKLFPKSNILKETESKRLEILTDTVVLQHVSPKVSNQLPFVVFLNSDEIEQPLIFKEFDTLLDKKIVSKSVFTLDNETYLTVVVSFLTEDTSSLRFVNTTYNLNTGLIHEYNKPLAICSSDDSFCSYRINRTIDNISYGFVIKPSVKKGYTLTGYTITLEDNELVYTQLTNSIESIILTDLKEATIKAGDMAIYIYLFNEVIILPLRVNNSNFGFTNSKLELTVRDVKDFSTEFNGYEEVLTLLTPTKVKKLEFIYEDTVITGVKPIETINKPLVDFSVQLFNGSLFRTKDNFSLTNKLV